MLLENLVFFLAASIVLVKAASFAVKYVLLIAEYLHITEFIASFIVVGFISTAPELLIGINASLSGNPSLGLATIIGSNVIDLTIVIGLIAFVGKSIEVKERATRDNMLFVLVTALPILLMLDSELSRIDGLILVGVCFAYLLEMVKAEKKFREQGIIEHPNVARNLVFFVVSMAVLFLASRFVVHYGLLISNDLSIPLVFTGLFLIAFGTCLPELTFSLKAIMAKHKESGLGNIMGCVAIDATFTIGVIALISPIKHDLVLFISGSLFMIFAALIISTFIESGKKITRAESLALFALYGLFVVMQLLLNKVIA